MRTSFAISVGLAVALLLAFEVYCVFRYDIGRTSRLPEHPEPLDLSASLSPGTSDSLPETPMANPSPLPPTPTPRPAPPHSWPPTPTAPIDVVMTAVDGKYFKKPNLNRFIWSLRETGSHAQVLIFCPRPDNCDFASLNRKFGNVRGHLYDRTSYWQKVELERFLQYDMFFSNPNNTIRFRNILISDDDVVFQRDPFATLTLPTSNSSDITTPAATFYGESEYMTLGECDIHTKWLNCLTDAPNMPLEIKQSTRICAGVTYANLAGAKLYLSIMAEAIRKTGCNDQGIHNWYYYTHVFQDRGLVIRKEEEIDSLAGNVGTSAYIQINGMGQALNRAGQILSLVHQYKYGEVLSKIYADRYPVLPEVQNVVGRPFMLETFPEKFGLSGARGRRQGVFGVAFVCCMGLVLL
ncbi:hypothetical protein HDU98_001713 [Podochytrium sp. JEL0797]|nr:hypothetical protein HDU98_001713 [Podochytrium sp. JEL0797]